MRDHAIAAIALQRIEAAERQTPFCWCGAPTVPAQGQGAIRLTCSARDHRPRLRRLLSLDFGHTDQPILDLADLKPLGPGLSRRRGS